MNEVPRDETNVTSQAIADLLSADLLGSTEGIILRDGETYSDFDLAKLPSEGLDYGSGIVLRPTSAISFTVMSKDSFAYEVRLNNDAVFTKPDGSEITIEAGTPVFIKRMNARTQFDQ